MNPYFHRTFTQIYEKLYLILQRINKTKHLLTFYIRHYTSIDLTLLMKVKMI